MTMEDKRPVDMTSLMLGFFLAVMLISIGIVGLWITRPTQPQQTQASPTPSSQAVPASGSR